MAEGFGHAEAIDSLISFAGINSNRSSRLAGNEVSLGRPREGSGWAYQGGYKESHGGIHFRRLKIEEGA